MSLPVILTDIEGTTSSISFVKDVMFPYAEAHLDSWVRRHASRVDVAEQLDAVRQELGRPNASIDACVEALLQWSRADKKVTPLKALQGYIWKNAFETGEFSAHLYEDALAALLVWHSLGRRLAVYSSGSIGAQKLYFGHTTEGDLLHLFESHFDATSGSKKEASSYVNICRDLGVAANDVVFLSDVCAELDAAAEAGLKTVWVVREGELPTHEVHHVVADFDGLIAEGI